MMKPKIDFLTIAVTDLEKSVTFSKEAVDTILQKALKAGATQIGQTQDEPWGYSANIADPNGHQWEITFMPGTQPYYM